MIVKDAQGRERPQRQLWVFKNYAVSEETAYGSNDEETKQYWYVAGVGSCQIGKDAFETRQEALADARRQLQHQISRLQGYLNDLT